MPAGRFASVKRWFFMLSSLLGISLCRLDCGLYRKKAPVSLVIQTICGRLARQERRIFVFKANKKGQVINPALLGKVVGVRGFEPPTPASRRRLECLC